MSQPNGALEFMNVEDLSSLTEIAPQQRMVLDIFSLAWPSASTDSSEVPKVRDRINKVLPMLVSNFSRTDAVTFTAFLGDTLLRLPREVRSTYSQDFNCF